MYNHHFDARFIVFNAIQVISGHQFIYLGNIHILLDVLLCSIAILRFVLYLLQITRKNTQRYSHQNI